MAVCRQCDEEAVARGLCRRCYRHDWKARHPGYQAQYREKLRKLRAEVQAAGVGPVATTWQRPAPLTPEVRNARSVARHRERLATEPGYRERVRASQRAYRERNRERLKAWNREYQNRNRERISARARERYVRKPKPTEAERAARQRARREAKNAEQRQRRLSDPAYRERMNEHGRRFYARNRERLNAQRRERLKSDPDFRARRGASRRLSRRVSQETSPNYRATHARHERERRARRRAERQAERTDD